MPLLGSFCAHFLKSFNHKWVLNFVKGFCYICWDDHMAFIFQFVNMVYHVDWFACIEESLHPRNKPNLIMVYELFDVLLNFVKGLFCIYWDYNMILSFSLLIWCIILIDLHILKNPCIPRINPIWSWCMSFLMCFWILFVKILLRIFASMFIGDIGL